MAKSKFPIYSGQELNQSLEKWLVFAPPAGREKHWKDGRSAKELARAWRLGLPEEVRTVLDSDPALKGFEPCMGLAEVETRLDTFGGSTRNNDLVVFGAAGEARVIIDVEGKADEAFGRTVAESLDAVKEKPRSKLPSRIGRLARALVPEASEGELGRLRYQLLFGIGACLIRGAAEHAERVVFLVHEFRSTSTRADVLERNARDLDAFVAQLARSSAYAGSVALGVRGGIVGPIRVRGLTEKGQPRIPDDMDLYVAKASRMV